MTLQKAQAEQLCIEVVRSRPGPNNLDGLVLAFSPQWCLLASIEAFDPDGFWLISRDTIRSIRFTRFHAFRHRVATTIGVLSGIRVPVGLDVTDTVSLLTGLARWRRFAIVYRETDSEWWSWHSAVLGVDGAYLRVHGFDGAGQFESRIRRCRIAGITCFRIATRYLTAYQTAAPCDFDAERPLSGQP